MKRRHFNRAAWSIVFHILDYLIRVLNSCANIIHAMNDLKKLENIALF